MKREDFVINYLKALDVHIDGRSNPNVRVTLQLIESIYDVQQQINELQEKDNDSCTNDN